MTEAKRTARKARAVGKIGIVMAVLIVRNICVPSNRTITEINRRSFCI